MVTDAAAEGLLLQRAKERDGGAFEQLMRLYLGLVYHYIRIYVGNEEDCKDLLQETMLAVWTSLPSFAEMAS